MKKIAFATLIILTFLLLGVESCEKATTAENGIVMNFVENAPAKVVATDQTVNIYVDIANKGASNVNKGEAKFYLINAAKNLDGVTTKLSNTNLLETGITASTARLIFAKNAKVLLDIKDPFLLTLSLKSCYPYDTDVRTKICIARENNPICSITGEKITSTSNSAGPIKVTSLKEEVVANKLMLTAIIENKGVQEKSIGDVYLKSANCDILQDVTNTNYIDELLKEKKVDVEIKTTGFKCNLEEDTKGTISLTNNKGILTCEKKLEAESEETQFQLLLHYKYQDSITTAITLVKS